MSNAKLIIGLGHYSRSGKDTFANHLVFHINHYTVFRAKKIPFAWKLKQICHDLYAWDGMREPEFYDTDEGAPLRDVKLPTIGKTPVEIWIDFGTPAVRENVYRDTWTDFLFKGGHACDVLVIPDARFLNEVNGIKERGGLVYKIERPGYGPRPGSVADNALNGYDGWDRTIWSDSVEGLRKTAVQLFNADILQKLNVDLLTP